MSHVPQELNWVEKRAACTVAVVFNHICDGITEDIKAFNSSAKMDNYGGFSATLHSSGTTIFVGQPHIVPRRRVVIGIVDDRLEVQQDWDGAKWNASVGLNDEGRCILRVGDKELEQWQFRKKALEGLLFGDRAR